MFRKPPSNFFEEPPGRGFEIIIGLLVAFVALVFWGLLWLLITSASLSVGSVVGGLVLALTAGWFSQLAYRLILHKQRTDSGLFSPWALKFWVLFLGASSVALLVIGLSTSEYRMAMGAGGMLVACVAGWQIAQRASRCAKT